MLSVTFDNRTGKFMVEAPIEYLEVCRAIPHRKWDKKTHRWVVAPLVRNLKYLKAVGAKFDVVAQAAVDALELGPPVKYGKLPAEFKYKFEPFDHQREALLRGLDQPAYALFMDPGTGKTKVIIDDAAVSWLRGGINANLVFCPNSIKSNWVDELEIHDPMEREVHQHTTMPRLKKFISLRTDKPKWLIVGIESLSAGAAYSILKDYVCYHKTNVVIDESSRIKNFNSTRTTRAIDLGSMGKRRRIATGTPMTKGVQHLWSQYQFLDEYIIDMGYYSFRNQFCVMGGFKAKKIIGNKDVDELLEIVRPYTYIAKKEDCLDLPPKTFQVRRIQPSKEMVRLYNELVAEGAVLSGDRVTSYEYVITRDLRLQQITGGFVYTDPIPEEMTGAEFAQAADDGRLDPIDGGNPKIEELNNLADEIDGKIIVWCRYRAEIGAVAQCLRKRGDGKVVEYHGGVSNDDRTDARRSFQSDPDVKYFVGQQSTGGIGITLHASNTTIYFSNSFNLEDRIQSEDRTHRSGQKSDSVTYVDLVIDQPDWVDSKVLKSLRNDRDYVDYLMEELSHGE